MEAMIRKMIREEVLEALIFFANTQATKATPAPTPAPVVKKAAPKVVTPPPAPTPAPVVVAPEVEDKPAVEEGAITEEMLRKLCADTATKLGSADRVKKVLEGFGGKVYQVKDFAGAYEAIKMLTETANDSW